LERERAQRIAESEAAEAAITNPRQLERERMSSILTPLGLAIRDITPDGHCLYAAVSDQLTVKLGIKVRKGGGVA
jgi:OTU domain-containing protein 6